MESVSRDRRSAPRFDSSLVTCCAGAIFLLALVLRLLGAFAPHPRPFSDMEDYDRAAVSFLMGNGLAMSPEYRAYRAPGYPLFLALLYTVGGRNLLFVRIVQAFLSAGSCVFLFLYSYLLLSKKPRSWMRIGGPLLAGVTLALYKTHIFLSGVLLTETLFVFLLLAFAVILCGPSSWGSLRRLAAPILLGILALIRPIAVVYLPALFLSDTSKERSEASHRKYQLKKISLSLGLFLLPIVPWTIRNAVVLHAFIPLSTNGGVNFYIGHHPGYSYWSTGEKEAIRAQTNLAEVAESRLFARLGFDYIFHHPVHTLLDTWRKVVYFFRPGIPPWPMGDRGYDLIFPMFPSLRTILAQWNWTFLILLPVGGALTWKSLPNGRPILVLAMCHILATLLFFARSRFRVPLEPFFLFWIAFAVVSIAQWFFLSLKFAYGKRVWSRNPQSDVAGSKEARRDYDQGLRTSGMRAS